MPNSLTVSMVMITMLIMMMATITGNDDDDRKKQENKTPLIYKTSITQIIIPSLIQ